MKAIVYNKKAHPDKLVYCDVEKPVPNDNEVLVKVIAVSVNAADYRSMEMGLIPKKKIFGSDIAGIVESVGKNILQFVPGDEVIGEIADYGFGGFAEYAVATEKFLVHKPANVSFEDAAALPISAVTALQALRDKGNIKQGDKVLIIGSGGGVGTFAIQLAKYFEATVTAVCSTKNVEQSKNLGADYVIDYTKKKVTKSDMTYDIIIAINGNYPLLACKRMLSHKGTYVIVGGALIQILKANLFGWLFSFGSKKIRSLASKAKQKDLEFIASLTNDGKIKPVIEKYYPLEKTAEAVRYLSEKHNKGKVIIRVNQ
jgi:NADPH:quinone reductase-like Zn-dependent oxidoreductase